jgi:hypothetical protein
MRYRQSFVLCILALVIVACTQQPLNTQDAITLGEQALTRKVIDLSGYSLPYPNKLLETIPAMKARGYAGSVFKLEGLWSDVFVNDPEHLYNEAAFLSNYPTLKQIKRSGYSENFVLIYSQMSAGWSWLSDTDWGYAEAKLGGFAKAAKEAGARGLLLDTEAYGFSPWRYDQAYYQGKTLAQVSQVVRERGKRFIQIVQTELPNAKIFSLWLVYPILEQWSNYELLKPFFEGMLEAALPTVQFIDGNEPSYYFLTGQEFDAAKRKLQEAYTAIDPSLTTNYKNQVKVANAIYVDGVMNTWNSPRFIGYYFANNAERLQLIQHNAYHALRTTNEYLWVYNENMDYYNNRIPAGLVDNLKEGVRKIKTAQALGFSIKAFVARATLEFDRKISVSGNVKSSVQNSGVEVRSGFVDEYGDESACVVYNAYGDYDCIFPYGTTVTLRPTLAGKQFTPNQLSFTNLTQNKGGQNFTQR